MGCCFTLVFQIPPEKLFWVCFWGPVLPPHVDGVWKPRVITGGVPPCFRGYVKLQGALNHMTQTPRARRSSIPPRFAGQRGGGTKKG